MMSAGSDAPWCRSRVSGQVTCFRFWPCVSGGCARVAPDCVQI